MRARKWGRVLTVASYSVIEPIPTIGISNTLRSAVVGWAKTLAGEVARDGITVNMLLPGVIATDRSLQLHQGIAQAAEHHGRGSAEANSKTTIPVGRWEPLPNSAQSQRSSRARWPPTSPAR